MLICKCWFMLFWFCGVKCFLFFYFFDKLSIFYKLEEIIDVKGIIIMILSYYVKCGYIFFIGLYYIVEFYIFYFLVRVEL